MKLSVIIVNYNVEHFLEQCLQSVDKAAKNLPVEIFVADNNSVDGSVAMVRKKFPHVRLIANEQNTGFAKANNQAIREAKGEYILLLNPDTVVQEDTFSKTIGFMDGHPDAGGLGVMMLDGKGNFLPESKRGLPTPAVAFFKVFGLSALFPNSKTFGKYHLGFLDKNKTHEVDVLSGAFMLLRRAALNKIAEQEGQNMPLDETFFMYGEDIDLSYRIKKAGYKNYYFADTRIIHYKGESTRKSSVNYVLVFYNAMAIFARKHFAKEQAALFSFLIYLAIFLRAGAAIIRRFLTQIFVPLFDGVMLYGGLLFIKDYYEHSVKNIDYPDELVYVAFGAYVSIWLLAVFLSGGYDRPVRLQRMIRGIFAGTGMILALYALLPEDYRFSRALILLGTGWALIELLASRMLLHLFGLKHFQLEGSTSKRIAIAGSEEEYQRVVRLLKDSSVKISFTGFISSDGSGSQSENYIGKLNQLNDIIGIYKIDEVIFCAKNISSERIIDAMAGSEIEFKIAPQDATSIIGSNSINTAGDLYTIDVNSVNKPSNRRKKRIIDVSFSIICLVLYPVLLIIVKHPLGLLANIFRVGFGMNTWVGYADIDPATRTQQFLHNKKGILSPVDALRQQQITPEIAEKLNKIYAKDYSARNDIGIILKGFRSLGR